MVFFNRPDYYDYHQQIKQAGLQSYAVLARESFGSASRADTVAALPTDLDGVAIGNEPDGDGPSSWQMTQSSYRRLIRDCAPAVRARCPSARVIAGGMVSGQPGWLEPVASDIAQLVDFLDVHPYAKDPNEAQVLLDQYWETYLIPLMVLEWNRPTDQISSFVQMLERTAHSSSWFCWSDGMVPGFGLLDGVGVFKEEYFALQSALTPAQAPTPVYEYQQGFKMLHDRHPQLIGDPLENEAPMWPHSAFQRTTQGLMIWGSYKDLEDPQVTIPVGSQHGFISNSGQRYVWKEDHLERV